MSASIWKKTDQPRELDASALHPPPPPSATAAPFLPVASLSSPSSFTSPKDRACLKRLPERPFRVRVSRILSHPTVPLRSRLS